VIFKSNLDRRTTLHSSKIPTQEMMNASHAKPQDQGGLQTRVHQLEIECFELKQECDNLRRTNSMLVQNQLKGDSKLSELEGEVASLNDRLERAEAEAKYFEVRYKNRKWKYPLAVPTIPELCSLGYDERESERLVRCTTDIMDDTTKCQAVNNHDSLKELCISFESQEENFGGIMSKMKSKSLECIKIYSDIFSDLRPGDMDFLVSCPSLKSLWFYGDQLSDGDIVIMQDALRNNKTLTRLSLNFRDPPNDIDLHCLVPFVFDRTNLNSAYESNHHCLLEVCYWDNDVHYRRQINTGNAMWNRRKKIYIILSTRNINRRNAAHFESDDISIKHIPQILSILKPFSEHALYNEDYDTRDEHEVTPLSIAYEILRDWKMPELYSYLNLVDD